MADERMNTLSEAPATKTGYNFIMDKTGNARAFRAAYDTILAEFRAALAPVVTSHSMAEGSSKTVTVTAAKKMVYGKNVSIQLIFSVTSGTSESYLDFLLLTNITGTTGQGLTCTADDGLGHFWSFACVVVDDETFKFRVYPQNGGTFTDATAYTFVVSGTLITT